MIKNGHFGDMFSSNSLQSIRLFVGDICYKVCFSSCLNINITSTWKSRFILLIKWDGKKHDEDIKDIKISRCLYPKQLVRTIGWVKIKISRCLYPKQLVGTIGWVRIKIPRCLYPKQLVRTIGWVKIKISSCLYPKQLVRTIGWVKIKISRCLYPKQLVGTIGRVKIKIYRCLYPKQLVRTIGWVKIKIYRCLYPKQLVGTIGWVRMLCLKSLTFDLSEIQFENYSYLPRKHLMTTCLSYEMVKCEILIWVISLSCSIIFDVFFSALVRQQAYCVW